jgi:hypothetical protein
MPPAAGTTPEGVAADVLFERWPPKDEAKAEAAGDYCEAAAGKLDLPIGHPATKLPETVGLYSRSRSAASALPARWRAVTLSVPGRA